jgi:hypothetical protein
VEFADACAILETALDGDARRAIVDDASDARDLRASLARLVHGMRSHAWKAGTHRIRLSTIIPKLDADTRREGLHVLHDWDGVADTINDDIIPIEVLSFVSEQRGHDPADRVTLAILLDYYFMYVLALLSLRVWDEGDADANLDRLTTLLHALQGPRGSGQQFADDAETLMLVATSHFEIDERGYDRLLARVRTLNDAHQTAIALAHASSIGGHLRFGFEATYARDATLMRDDNVADYPWLCYALAGTMRAYTRLHDAGVHGLQRDRVVEALVDGLSPDAAAFVGEPLASLAAGSADRVEFRAGYDAYRSELIDAFEPYRPSDTTFSPLSLFYNFSQNVLKGMVVDASLSGAAVNLTLNDMLTGLPQGAPKNEAKETIATTLMSYAQHHPHRIRGRLMPVIVYDPGTGRRAFANMMRAMKAG